MAISHKYGLLRKKYAVDIVKVLEARYKENSDRGFDYLSVPESEEVRWALDVLVSEEEKNIK